VPKQQEIDQEKSKENHKCREEVEVVSAEMVLSVVRRLSALFLPRAEPIEGYLKRPMSVGQL
jgi:hypothetical protein